MEPGLHHSMEGTTRPLSALCKYGSKSFGSSSGNGLKSKSSSLFCTGRLWIFFVLGALIFIMGIVIGGLYFNIRDLTTSLEYTEVLPTYVPAVAMIVSGFAVFLLFWNRVKSLVVVTVLMCTTTALLDVVAAILTGTHVIQVIQSLLQCRYYSEDRQCKCSSPYSRTRLQLEYSVKDPGMYVFEDVDNCDSVQNTLLQLIYGLCAGYTMGVFLCLGSAIMASLVYCMELSRQKLHQDAYEEVYTVSGGSSVASESDNEQHIQQGEPVILQPRRISTERSAPNLPRRTSTERNVQNQPRRTSTERRAPTQPRRISTEKSATNEPRRTSTERNGPNIGLRRSQSFVQSRETTSLEESTDNLLTDTSLESSSATLQSRQKRRRHRRAMTLHNLDSKQLMLILNLQMRYLQESQSLQSSRSQTPVPSGRHTPNPHNTRAQVPASDRNQPPVRSQVIPNAAPRERPVLLTGSNNVSLRTGSVLPNTHIGENTVEDMKDIPRYVSLPKLPRRSPTPQPVYMNPCRPKSTSPIIPNSLSDPSMTHHDHMGPKASSKMDMLNQRLARSTANVPPPTSVPDYVNLPRNRHYSQPAQQPSRSHVLTMNPSREKYPDNHCPQVSAYSRSRTPSLEQSRGPRSQRPPPPVRSVSCDNSAAMHSRSISRNSGGGASRPRLARDDNYVELRYPSRFPCTQDTPQRLYNHGNGLQPGQNGGEELYSQPTKPPHILLNDTYVDLYPVQERSQEAARSHPPPPPPPPYPDFFTPVPPQSVTERRSTVDVARYGDTPDMGESLYGRHGLPRRNYDNYPHPQEPSSQSQGNHGYDYGNSGSSSGSGSHGNRSVGQHRQYSRSAHNGAVTPAHAFRPIEGENCERGDSGHFSPPVRESSQYRPANPTLVLHNSDEDSDSEFMETVI